MQPANQEGNASQIIYYKLQTPKTMPGLLICFGTSQTKSRNICNLYFDYRIFAQLLELLKPER